MNNACPYRITAAAGTALARTSSPKIRHNPFCRKSFTTESAFLTHLVLLDQTIIHCPKFPTAASIRELGPCLSPNVANHSLKLAKNRGLGNLLHHQLPNSIYSYLLAINFFFILYLTKLKGNFNIFSTPVRYKYNINV